MWCLVNRYIRNAHSFCSVSCPFSSVQFSRSVMSDFLQPHGLQHARPPCPSSIPRAYFNSCQLSQWCHPTISSFVVSFSSRLQSFPASGSSQMSQFFISGGQRNGVSASASAFSPSNEYSGLISFRKYLQGISPCSLRDSEGSSPTPPFKSINSLALSFCYSSVLTSIHGYWKNHSFDYVDYVP